MKTQLGDFQIFFEPSFALIFSDTICFKKVLNYFLSLHLLRNNLFVSPHALENM